MTSRTRIHRPRQQTAGQAMRKRFQRAEPGLSELLASGDYSEPLSQAEYWELRKAVLRLKQRCEAAGLSLADVAEQTGIDRAAICRLETANIRTPPSARSTATPTRSASECRFKSPILPNGEPNHDDKPDGRCTG